MNYHNITYPDMNNGDGLRVVLWLSGCSHRCKGCQNPQTWDVNSGIPFDEFAREELFRELGKDYISGLTLTGGDPLFENNLDDVLDLINKIRLLLPQKTIWLYTGYKFEEIMFPLLINTIPSPKEEKRINILKTCDILIDGKYVDYLRDITLKWRGSSNQRLINIKESIRQNKIILWED